MCGDAFHNLVLVEEMDLLFRRMYVDIDAVGHNGQRQVNPRVSALGKQCCIHGIKRPTKGCAFHQPVIDEAKEGGLFGRPIPIAHPTFDGTTKRLHVQRCKVHKVARECRTMHVPYHIERRLPRLTWSV